MDLILIWIAIIITGLALLMMVGFGAKNASSRLRGQGPLALAAFGLPIVVFVIIYLVNSGNESQLAMSLIMTAVVLILSGLAALLIAGVRGLVK